MSCILTVELRSFSAGAATCPGLLALCHPCPPAQEGEGKKKKRGRGKKEEPAEEVRRAPGSGNQLPYRSGKDRPGKPTGI